MTTSNSIVIPLTTRPLITPPEQLPPASLEFRAKLKWRLRAKIEGLRLWWLHYRRRTLFSSLKTMPSMPIIPHPTAPPPIAWPTSSVTKPLPPLFDSDEITEKRAALGQTTKPLVVLEGLRPGEFNHAYREAARSGIYPTMDDAVAAVVDELTGNEDINNPFTNGVLQRPFPELPAWHPYSQKTLKRIRIVKVPPNEPTPPLSKPAPQVTWAEKIMIENQETLPHRWQI